MQDTHGLQYTLDLRQQYAPWFSSEEAPLPMRIHGRGYAFVDDTFVQGQALVDAMYERCRETTCEASAAALKKLIPRLNGCWAVVAEWPGEWVIAATDRLRSTPIFYAQTQCGLMLSSSVRPILEQLPRASIAEPAALEYLLAGFVTGSDTLYKDIHQVQPGESLAYDLRERTPRPVCQKYYRFLPARFLSKGEQELERELETVLDEVFARYTRAFKSRQIVVPLSGGLDSRLLCAMLRRHGATNVLCYSYGPRGNLEASASRQVAKALGYHWQFVEYQGEALAQWACSQVMGDYWAYAMQGSSLPHFQDLMAVTELINRKVVAGATFVPGHTGDFISGGHIPRELYRKAPRVTPHLVIASLVTHHLNQWPQWRKRLPSPHARSLYLRLTCQLELQLTAECSSDAALYEGWEFENRQAKFIANSVRVYEFCGQQWALPYWDYRLCDFFLSVRPELRWRQRLYVNTLVNRIFTGALSDLADIPLANGLTPRGQALRLTRWLQMAVRRSVLSSPLLRDIAHWLKRNFAPAPRDRNLECIYTGGMDPRRVSVGSVLERFTVEQRLPPILFGVIRPHVSRSVSEVGVNAIASAIALARAYESLPR